MLRFEAPPYADQTRIEAYDEVMEILRSPHFIQNSHKESVPVYGDVLLLTDGAVHIKRRQMISTLFSRGALQYLESEALMPPIEHLLSELAKDKNADGVVRTDLVPLVRAMLTRITALVTGVDGVDTDEKTERFRMQVALLAEASAVEWSKRPHDVVLADGVRMLDECVQEFLRPSYERRRAMAAEIKAGTRDVADGPTDLLMLLALHEGDGDFTEDYVWRECVLALVGASATTTQALPHAFMHLEDWLAEHPEDRTRVDDPEFLRRAATESLRLHLPAPALSRKAVQDVELKSGRRIAADEEVCLFFTHANLDTDKFGDDAHEYDLERELPAGTQPWGLNFGNGVHMCIGRPLVTGLTNRADPTQSTDGTMVKILRALYAHGVERDPDQQAQANQNSVEDAYASVPVIFRKL
ncbi:cytochrome P450 [Nocardioides hwasunensis]|uniref:Cytochrome P450 n=1 Tax=Nocardioides hwasunensis TaxID=397258 RepID=A0ABR8MG65_9ACTN|nr:cytochrome P450 [Nocardioides hwasunensis]MBD3915073.1 cytochrome P450 [Nocardioides hwasunensis]